MDNEILKEELFKNNTEHEVFKRQKHSTLNEVVKHVKEYNGRNFLVELNINSIVPFINRSDLKDQDDYWEHVVSLLFMNELDYRYNIKSNHSLDDEKRILSRGSKEEYNKYEEALLDRNDVIESINNVGIEYPRLHIIIEYINNDNIWNELVNYLANDLPFATMIYTDGEMPPIMDENRYVLFDKENEGIIHIPVKGYTYEKKI